MKIPNLSAPYPVNSSLKNRWLNSILFGTFVFSFLYIFRPFGIHLLPANHLWVTLGFGGICFVLMAIMNVGLFWAWPHFFAEHQWTTLKEILWSIAHIFIIGIGNYVFAVSIHFFEFTWGNLLRFELYTLAVGVFPVLISVLYKQNKWQHQFEQQSSELNAQILENKEPTPVEDTLISITDGNDQISLHPMQLVYAKAADNYVEIYLYTDSKLNTLLVRNTLKHVHSQINNPHIWKCHRSYLVNLHLVLRLSGNAQGYKLHLPYTAETIPVSRSLNSKIKTYFTNRPT